MGGRDLFISSTGNAPTDVFSNPDGILLEGKSVDDLLLGISTSVAAGIENYASHLDKQVKAVV